MNGPRDRRAGFLRMSGLDRSAAPPAETRKGAPLRPLTLPNLVGYLRIVLIGLFLWLSFSSDDGRSPATFVVFAAAAAGDYVDGLLARITGQYSRLGTLMDPFVDRVLIISGVLVCWHFELLPHWALVALIAREVVMLAVVAFGLSRGLDIEVNMVGRVAVWFVMAGLGLTLAADSVVFRASLYVGLVGSWLATLLYVRNGARQLRDRGSTAAA